MIAGLGIIAGQQEEVADPQHRRAQQIRLERQAVAVAARHLENRVDAGLQDHLRHRQRAGAHDRAGAVGHVDRIHQPAHAFGGFENLGKVGPLGRVDLHRD